MAENRLTMFEAVVWLLVCFPIGYLRMGQGMKWLVWLIIGGVSGGVGLLPMLIDYFMCASKSHTKGHVGPWEWFPSA